MRPIVKYRFSSAGFRRDMMQTQAGKMKGELLVEIKGKMITTTIKEFAPTGAKLQINDTGEVKGKYNASHMETVDILAKQDGTNEWESRAIEVTREGDTVMIMSKGTGRQETATAGRWEGEVKFMTLHRAWRG